MPIIKSAKKRVRQTKVRYARNLATKRTVRTATKALETAIESGKKAEVQKAFVAAQSAIDTAVKKNILPKKRAARMKSQLNAKAKAVAGSTAVAKTAKKAPAKKAAPKKAAAKKPAAKKAVAKKPAAKKKAATKK